MKALLLKGWNDMDSVQMTSNSPSRYRDAHLDVDFNGRFATLDSQRLLLTRKECDLLLLLVQNAGQVIPREILLMRVWGLRNGIRTRTLDVHISKLRKNLGAYSEQYIQTVLGIGYRFQPLRTAQRVQQGLPASVEALNA